MRYPNALDPTNKGFNYVYHYKGHLGNARYCQ